VAALAAVRRLSFAALDATTDAELQRELVRELFTAFNVDQVHVSRLAQDGTLGRGTMFKCVGDTIRLEDEWVLVFDEPSAVQEVAKTGAPLNEPDARNSPVLSSRLVERFNVASALFVPLTFDGEVRSVVVLISETPRRFSDEEVQLVHTLANQASAAFAVLEMKRRLGARADQQAALARAAGALNARLDQRVILETLCREADLALGGDLAGVYLGDGRSGGIGVAGHGIPEDNDWYGYVIRPGEGVGGQVLVTGEPVISNAYQTDVQVPENEVLRPIETAISVPVRWNGELKGALSVAFYSMRRIAEEDIDALQAIADLAAVACSNAEAFQEAKEAAMTDSLTGLLNHGAVQVRLRDEIWRARRANTPLCCLLLDLDNFKPINDIHGHLVGDQLLQQVASAIASQFRSYDGIGRFGGDEFVLVLPGMTAREARTAAQRLQELVEATGAAMGDMGAELTASVGLCEWREPLTAGELLERADRALRVAKHRGKRRAILATHETDDELARLEVQAGSPALLLRDLWDIVSCCERPRDVVLKLPDFLKEELQLEAVDLIETSELSSEEFPAALLREGAISRPTLEQLREALGPGGESVGHVGTPGSHAAVAVGRGGQAQGLLLLRSSARTFPLSVLRLAELLTGQAVTAMVGQSGGASRSAVGALAAAIDARDNYTHSHSEQVVGLACEVARRLGLPPEEVERVRDGAMLHDVGKVAIPNEILFKPGPLTAGEWQIMREHSLIGERILRRTPELAPIAPLVRHEHERWDGGGYPDGLTGTEIPVGSRIIFACDAYNAMITARPYREPMSQEDAISEVQSGSGTQFDPDVVEALLTVLSERTVAGPA
jgi:diguanylate cyclase (GGDEF)-like protein